MSLAHFALWFTRVSIGVGGAAWWNIVGICKMLAMSFICWACSFKPMGVFLWCMHSIWMTQLYVLDSICSSGGIVDSS